MWTAVENVLTTITLGLVLTYVGWFITMWWKQSANPDNRPGPMV